MWLQSFDCCVLPSSPFDSPCHLLPAVTISFTCLNAGSLISPPQEFLTSRKFKMMINSFLAVYAFATLLSQTIVAFKAVDNYSSTAPSGRCLPFFDNVKEAYSGSKLNGPQYKTTLLYAYGLGESNLRACTNQTGAVVDMTIKSKKVDLMRLANGCDVTNPLHRAQMEQYCLDSSGSDSLDCAAILNTPPLSNGGNGTMYPGVVGAPNGYTYQWTPVNITVRCSFRSSSAVHSARLYSLPSISDFQQFSRSIILSVSMRRHFQAYLFADLQRRQRSGVLVSEDEHADSLRHGCWFHRASRHMHRSAGPILSTCSQANSWHARLCNLRSGPARISLVFLVLSKFASLTFLFFRPWRCPCSV